MIKTVIFAVSGALIAATSPAFADTGRASAEPTANVTSNTAPAQTTSAKPVTAKRYCVIDTVTGSRLPQKTCQTREQWLDQGFDPLAK
ncbi:hypothetical protein [Sphingomonas sp. PB4P5]|uniref:hypothetical protein n=1 Tax=Parasphingomonas puruogangriensis TaxID=3096155 RepID=UPI002FCB3C74